MNKDEAAGETPEGRPDLAAAGVPATPVEVSAVVPTLGQSPHLLACLQALRGEGAGDLEIILVDGAATDLQIPPELVDQHVAASGALGFADANHLGLKAARGSLIALVNDDAIVQPGWLATLRQALQQYPEAASAQGCNLLLHEAERVDGCGLAWNGWWQAVQRKRGERAPAQGAPTQKIFGVSATAALYRRSALEQVSAGAEPLQIFDQTLGTYYEDVDLACRLRQHGFKALLVGAARALHAGSTSAPALGRQAMVRLYSNRRLVLARWLGRSFWLELPRIALRDHLDLLRALVAGRPNTALGILAGSLRAWRLLPAYLGFGPTALPRDELKRLEDAAGQVVDEGALDATATRSSASLPGSEEHQANTPRPCLSGLVVHWRNEEALQELLAAWPLQDSRFELIVVDNSRSLEPVLKRHSVEPDGESVRWVRPSHNLGFAGGMNRALELSRGRWVLLLNPDAKPAPGALQALLQGMERYPDVAGLVPNLVSSDGSSQHRWQLRPLPSPWQLWLQALLLPGVQGPKQAPLEGSAVAQPAAAALALRRSVLLELGGLDEGYYPAWFEDVDLARRLHRAGQTLRYYPKARFVHQLGASVPELGYGPFLWIYYRNLERYLRRHHGRLAAAMVRFLIPLGMGLRLILLPLRRPLRARTRRQAAQGLLATALGALSRWRWPPSFHQRHQNPKRQDPRQQHPSHQGPDLQDPNRQPATHESSHPTLPS